MFSLPRTSLNLLSSADFSASAWPFFSLLNDEKPVSVPPFALDLKPLAWTRRGDVCPIELENRGLLGLFSLVGEVMAVTAVEKSASQVGEEVSKGRDISRPKTCAECEDRARTSAGVRFSSLRAASAQLVEAVLPWPWNNQLRKARKEFHFMSSKQKFWEKFLTLACPPALPMAMP